MAMIRPNLTLIMDLDERVATKDTILEIKRNYAHITTPVIRTHAAGADEPVSNTARMMVKMGTYKYLRSEDEGADERWETIVEPWIKNMLHKVGNNMKVFNKRQREIGSPELNFDYTTLEFESGSFIVGVHPNATGWIDPELHSAVGTARTLLNNGTFADVVRVDIPAAARYGAQRDVAWEEWVVEHPEPEVSEEDVPEVAEEVEREPDNTREELLQEDIEAKSYENTAVPITDKQGLPMPVREEKEEEEDPFDFTVDYTVWEAFFADGSSRLFDSSAMAFLAE